MALEVLRRCGLATEGLRSKSWEEFAQPGSPKIDFVFTVCDRAAAESCPVWPGQPMTAHWGVEDPAAVEGSEAEKSQAFRKVFHALEARIRLFTALPIGKLEALRLKERLDEIGRTPDQGPPL